MNVELLKNLLAVQSVSYREQLMVSWLVHYFKDKPGVHSYVDKANNVYVVKGGAKFAPCVAAHIDTVQPYRKVHIERTGTRLVGFDRKSQVGIGADDKTGIFVCLNLIESTENIKAVFFATEEVGTVGALKSDPEFFAGVSYLIEYDCPSRNMLSYTSGGVRLFDNAGEFIKKANPVLQKHGTVLWQNHPYSDVRAIRRRFPVSCLNLSSGYYNWHADNEFASLPDVELAINMGGELIRELGCESYACPIQITSDAKPLVTVGPLHVPEAAP